MCFHYWIKLRFNTFKHDFLMKVINNAKIFLCMFMRTVSVDISAFCRRIMVQGVHCVFPRNVLFYPKYAYLRWEFIKENKKKELDQESDQEKKESFFFFSWSLSWSIACFLPFFLFSWSLSGRVLVLLFSYFLVFFYKFPPLEV